MFQAMRAVAPCVALAVIGVASPVRAWTSGSRFTDPCHEALTLEAARQAGFPGGATPPPLDEESERIASDLGFHLEDGERDPWRLAMVIGVRDVDLGGHEHDDIPALAREAADPDLQADHCLRAADHDGAAGDVAAAAACRAFIRAHVEAALGPGDEIDMTALERVRVPLIFRGETRVDVNRFGLEMGRAVHAVQDGFTHSFRTDDGMRVTHVLNYIDYVEERLSEPRDGHVHESILDHCSDMTPLVQRNFDSAGRASAELLLAVNDPTGGRTGRLARVDEVLDRWLTVEPGCTFENDYCNAAELDELAGCGVAPGAPSGSSLFLALLVGAALLRRRRAGRTGAGLLAVLFVAAGTAGTAAAQPDPQGEQIVTARERQPGDPLIGEEPRIAEGEDFDSPIERGFGFSGSFSGSFDEESIGVALGARLDVARRLILGLDAEFNPWFSLSTGNSARGTVNLYLTAIVVYGVVGPVEIRSTVSAGMSVLLFNLVGASSGSMGPFFGFAPIGIAVRLTRHVRFVVDPGGFYASVPQLSGILLVRRMHRASIGIHITL